MPKKAQGAFRTISEVADWLDIPAHVLRFWESKFSQIKPVKRAGGRRYYRPEDMLLIGGIKKLLHDDGLTIRGVQKMLKEDGVKDVSAHSQELDMPSDDEAARRRAARRARRKERSNKARAAKPPLTPLVDAPAKEAETAEDVPEAPFTEAEPEAGQPDNVVQWPSRPPEEPEEIEPLGAEEPAAVEAPAEPVAEEPAVEPIAEAEETDEPEIAAEPEPEPVAQAEESEPEFPTMNLEEAVEAPSEAEELGEPVAAEPAPPAEAPAPAAAAAPIEIPDDPDPAVVTLSDKGRQQQETLKRLRRSDPDEIADKAPFKALHDRLTALRDRMADQ